MASVWVYICDLAGQCGQGPSNPCQIFKHLDIKGEYISSQASLWKYRNTITKSYIQWGAQHLRIKQYEHLKGFSVTIFARTQKTESDSAVDPLTKCQNCHLRSLLDYFKSSRLPWLGLWRDAVGSDNARQNFAVVTTMEETDPGLSQLRAFSKLSIQIFIHASSHLRRDKHEFHFCSKLLISWPLCRWQRGFGAPPTLPRQSVTQQLCPPPTE